MHRASKAESVYLRHVSLDSRGFASMVSWRLSSNPRGTDGEALQLLRGCGSAVMVGGLKQNDEVTKEDFALNATQDCMISNLW